MNTILWDFKQQRDRKPTWVKTKEANQCMSSLPRWDRSEFTVFPTVLLPVHLIMTEKGKGKPLPELKAKFSLKVQPVTKCQSLYQDTGE